MTFDQDKQPAWPRSRMTLTAVTSSLTSTLVILILSALIVIASGSQCFCQLEGQIDDCYCSVDAVDYFNNMKIFPRLQSLLQKPFFRYFQYNARKECPFWDDRDAKCKSKNCGVNTCTPEEIPPGLKDHPESVESPHFKYTQDAQEVSDCDGNIATAKVDGHISDSALEDLAMWRDHDENQESFCEVDADQCPDCDYVDLTRNPERFTGYSGEASRRIWRAIYEENCFSPPNANQTPSFSAAFLQDKLEELCVEKRAFYRAVSGLHSSITIHLCANYLMASPTASSPFLSAKSGEETELFGPNLEEFKRRFDPVLTNSQGPFWLKNLYFVYLLELRALHKVSPVLEKQFFFTGNDEEDKETQIAVKELLNLIRSFPDHFDERPLFNGLGKEQLLDEFRGHFLNISKIMDCVSCDKCKLWGKLQITGLGTALKILFADSNRRSVNLNQMAEHLQTLQPPKKDHALDYVSSGFRLSRSEIVALFNAFGRISTSIRQLERFREMMRQP